MSIGFLFDNDGVLIDSMPYHWMAWEQLMQQCPELKMSHDFFSGTFGKRNDLILKELIPDASSLQREEWASRKEEIFRALVKGKIKLLDGMESFLQELKEANIPRIIASSTPVENLELFLKTTVLGQYFDMFCSAEQVAHGKPFPDVFVEAASRLDLKPEQCIVLEDAPAGVRAGQAAGCFVVALGTTHEKEDLENYDFFVPSPKELHLQELLKVFNEFQQKSQ